MKMMEKAEMGKNEIVLFESSDGAVTLPVLADAFDACVGESYEE
jgi:hypothetical protein